MKRLVLLLGLIISLNASNLYFNAFINVQKAKRYLNTDPQKAQRLFIEAYGYLKQVVNTSIEKNKPSANAFNLLGEMYLNGWGVKSDREKAIKLLCAAQELGNLKAKNQLKKLDVKCQPITMKELKQ